MAHIRKQIRAAAVATLKAMTPSSVGERVYPSRVDPLEVEQLPALRVYTIRDRAERLGQREDYGVRSERTVQLIVEAVVRVDADLEDALDDLSVEVEEALGDNDLGGIVSDLYLVEATEALSGEGDKQAGLCRMEFEAVTEIAEGKPQTALP